MLTLIIQQKDKDTIRQEIGDEVVTLGRVKANTITITGDTAISRQHCKFELEGEELFVSDMGSSNGTRINGKPIGTDRVRLAGSDRIQIGSTVVTLEGLASARTSGKQARASRRGATARADGTVFGDGYVKCGKCGNNIDTKRRKSGQKVGCVRCRSVYVLPEA